VSESVRQKERDESGGAGERKRARYIGEPLLCLVSLSVVNYVQQCLCLSLSLSLSLSDRYIDIDT
jgi:hypothetical protein